MATAMRPIKSAPDDGTIFLAHWSAEPEHDLDGSYDLACYTDDGYFMSGTWNRMSECETIPTHWIPLDVPLVDKSVADGLADALRPILAELVSDPMAVQFFDLRIIEKAKAALAAYQEAGG